MGRHLKSILLYNNNIIIISYTCKQLVTITIPFGCVVIIVYCFLTVNISILYLLIIIIIITSKYIRRCDQGDEENKVMFYLNEGVYDYPGCNVGLCSWKFIENKFRHYLRPDGCNDEVCRDRSRASGVRSAVWVVALIPIALAYLRV